LYYYTRRPSQPATIWWGGPLAGLHGTQQERVQRGRERPPHVLVPALALWGSFSSCGADFIGALRSALLSRNRPVGKPASGMIPILSRYCSFSFHIDSEMHRGLRRSETQAQPEVDLAQTSWHLYYTPHSSSQLATNCFHAVRRDDFLVGQAIRLSPPVVAGIVAARLPIPPVTALENNLETILRLALNCKINGSLNPFRATSCAMIVIERD